ncbi:methionine gamma-lyase family protein, partial [Bacillus sp. SIMBA_069]
MFSFFSHGEKLRPLVMEVEATISERHRQIAAMVDTNQLKVLRSFQKHEVNEFHFSPSTGY